MKKKLLFVSCIAAVMMGCSSSGGGSGDGDPVNVSPQPRANMEISQIADDPAGNASYRVEMENEEGETISFRATTIEGDGYEKVELTDENAVMSEETKIGLIRYEDGTSGISFEGSEEILLIEEDMDGKVVVTFNNGEESKEILFDSIEEAHAYINKWKDGEIIIFPPILDPSEPVYDYVVENENGSVWKFNELEEGYEAEITDRNGNVHKGTISSVITNKRNEERKRDESKKVITITNENGETREVSLRYSIGDSGWESFIIGGKNGEIYLGGNERNGEKELALTKKLDSGNSIEIGGWQEEDGYYENWIVFENNEGIKLIVDDINGEKKEVSLQKYIDENTRIELSKGEDGSKLELRKYTVNGQVRLYFFDDGRKKLSVQSEDGSYIEIRDDADEDEIYEIWARSSSGATLDFVKRTPNENEFDNEKKFWLKITDADGHYIKLDTHGREGWKEVSVGKNLENGTNVEISRSGSKLNNESLVLESDKNFLKVSRVKDVNTYSDLELNYNEYQLKLEKNKYASEEEYKRLVFEYKDKHIEVIDNNESDDFNIITLSNYNQSIELTKRERDNEKRIKLTSEEGEKIKELRLSSYDYGSFLTLKTINDLEVSFSKRDGDIENIIGLKKVLEIDDNYISVSLDVYGEGYGNDKSLRINSGYDYVHLSSFKRDDDLLVSYHVDGKSYNWEGTKEEFKQGLKNRHSMNMSTTAMKTKATNQSFNWNKVISDIKADYKAALKQAEKENRQGLASSGVNFLEGQTGILPLYNDGDYGVAVSKSFKISDDFSMGGQLGAVENEAVYGASFGFNF